ncbi:hypothetical protein NBRC110019_14640 [Neptunitalea chrysea]|uniref:Uncharacterized protein n=1 Tax=Neptunitalea chrysea TaxID=1647581 RepID=A0A9W6B712_9FLAO|nr:hypothetical protein NBRC110019_14640 [Neptunitalea chrysea]
MPFTNPKYKDSPITPLTIKSKIIQKWEGSGLLVNIYKGSVLVIKKLIKTRNIIRFKKFLKGNINSFLNGLRSFPYLCIK